MVLDDVPNIQGVFGVLVAVLGLSASCSDGRFEGCEASRTCPPKGGESGADSGGDSGTGEGGDAGETSTGGDSGGGSGGSAGTGDDTGGEGGMGGVGGDTEPPTVVSISPADGEEDVERDIAITMTFSEPIDEDSVKATSTVLTGPEGEVTGTLSVDGNVVSFVPNRKLWLLGDYTLAVTDAVADLAGNSLVESVEVGFRVRDGRWSERSFPFGPTAAVYVGDFARNPLGDMAVLMGRNDVPMGLWGPFWGGVYHAAAEEWSAAGEIPTANGAYNTQIIIDTAGRALLSWSNDVTHAWSRTTNGSQWEDAGALGSFANVSVTSTGLATAAWRTTDGFDTQTMDLSDGSPEASGRIGISDGIWGVPLASLDRTAILLWTRSTMSGDVLWLSWKDGSTWLQPEQIASAPQFGQFEFDADEQGNIVVAWREDERLWSRIYERATDSWSEELFVAPTSTNQSITFIDMTNGNALLGFNTGAPDPATWAVMYEAGKGWVESSLVRLHQVNAYVGAALDDAGNGIAISTAEGLGVQVRRYLAGHGWESPPALDVGITGNLWAAAAPDRSVTVVSNTGIGTTRTACAIRFE